MKHVHVVAAIIIKDQKILAMQRGYGKFKGCWEFPGGKVEANETLEEALKREIFEELESTIKIKEHFDTLEYTYSDFHLVLDCFICELTSEFVLKEHQDAKWLDVGKLYSVPWLEANISLVHKIEEYLE